MICIGRANTKLLHSPSPLSVCLYHSPLGTNISALTIQTDTRNLLRELNLNGKSHKKTEATKEWSLTRVSFINDKPEEESCQKTQLYNHFDSSFTDKEEEILALNKECRQDLPQSFLYIYLSAGILFIELCILICNSFCFLLRVIQCEEFPGSLEISEAPFSRERGPVHPLGVHWPLESQGT